MTNTKTHRAIAALLIPTSAPKLISLAQNVETKMTGNPSFPNPNPPLATFHTSFVAFQTAETAAVSRAKGAVTLRDEKRADLVSQLQVLRAYVQSVADANPANAASIIESAGMSVRKTPVRAPRVFAAKPGTVSGAVKLVTNSHGAHASYEWEQSTDGGKTWVALPPTTQAKTSVTGLAAGTSAQFRFRAVTSKGVTDWSPAVAIAVQ